MQRNVTVQTAAAPAELYAVIADLGTYAEWLDVVVDSAPTDSDAWLITLRAAVGPFARSKRLRVVRTVADGVAQARFERREIDGRDHADWIMDALVTPNEDGTSSLTLDLEYTGGLWIGPLDGVLGRAIEQALSRLPDYLAARES